MMFLANFKENQSQEKVFRWIEKNLKKGLGIKKYYLSLQSLKIRY
jgi:hypothetical protein